MSEETRCTFCGSTPAGTHCTECGKAQSGLEGWVARHPLLVGTLRFVATALIVPLALWAVSATYSLREEERHIANRRHLEVAAAMPRALSAIEILQTPCLGNDPQACLAAIDPAYQEYVQAIQHLESTVVRNFEDLAPSAFLLTSLERTIAMELSRQWSTFKKCVEGENSPEECTAQRRDEPYPDLAVSHFMIDFLHCALHEQLAEEGDLEEKLDHCDRMVERQRALALDAPRELVDRIEGPHLPVEMRKLGDRIWCERIAPAAGWDDQGRCSGG
ncbi:MAG: hypothetical protein AAF481_00640 [Acidobacteriota bacterium]